MMVSIISIIMIFVGIFLMLKEVGSDDNIDVITRNAAIGVTMLILGSIIYNI